MSPSVGLYDLLTTSDSIGLFIAILSRKPAGGGPPRLNTAGSSLLFGGKPGDFNISAGAAASQSFYSGCLADISINGARLDFTESTVQDSSVGQKCFTIEEKEAMALEQSRIASNGLGFHAGEPDVVSTTPAPTITTAMTPTTNTATSTAGPEEEVNPTPFMKCALPYRGLPTAKDISEATMADYGALFGNLDRYSRMEFEHPKAEGPHPSYSIDFKTNQGDGVIFMWPNFDSADFVAVFMRKGFLHFAFDPGAGPAFLNSTVQYNDSQWHTVLVERHEKDGELMVDGVSVATGSSGGSTKDVNAGTTIYAGGLPEEGWNKVATRKKLLNVDSPFKGCLKNFRKNEVPLTLKARYSVTHCAGNEPGYFFYPNNAGYLKIADNFKVGRQIKLSMSIKPRNPSGILVAVHGAKDFMVLQLLNGTIKFTVDSGNGQLSSAFTKDAYELCDGEWHTIRVIKSKNVVTLALDNQHTNPGIGPAGKAVTDTNGPLYLGGHPDPSGVPGIETTEQFVGCMKDFIVEGRQFKINYQSMIGKVGMHSCPSD